MALLRVVELPVDELLQLVAALLDGGSDTLLER